MEKRTIIVCDGINPQVKKTFEALSEARNQTASELLRELVLEFVKRHAPKTVANDRRKVSYFTRLK